MTRLITISVTSSLTAIGSAATSAIFQASWSVLARFSSLRCTRTRFFCTVDPFG
jgi:hypothetical protein